MTSTDPMLLDHICCKCQKDLTQPKIVPCGHDLCRECLTSLLSSSTDAACPKCKHPIMGSQNIEETVQALPDDLAMAEVVNCAKILDGCAKILNKQQDRICSRCNVLAEVCCLECHYIFCYSHSDIHSRQKETKHHRLDKLSFTTPVTFAANRDVNCSGHTSAKADLFCTDHSAPLCQSCAVSDHRKCPDVISLETKTTSVRRELGHLSTRLSNSQVTLSQALDKIRSAENVMLELEETYHHIKKLLDSCFERHMDPLRASSSQVRSAMPATKDTLTVLHGRAVAHGIAVKRVQEIVSGSEILDMPARLTRSVNDLYLDPRMLADIKNATVTSPKTDTGAVTRFKHDLINLLTTLIPERIQCKQDFEENRTLLQGTESSLTVSEGCGPHSRRDNLKEISDSKTCDYQVKEVEKYTDSCYGRQDHNLSKTTKSLVTGSLGI